MQTWRFDGHIAGIGTASGTRLVIGMWDVTPFGAFADVMIEDASGHRTLVAPTQQVADFVAATYGFDTVRVEAVTLRRDVASVSFGAPSLQITLDVGRRTVIGGLLRTVPRPLSRSRRWLRALDPLASRLRRGVHTHGQASPERHEYYCALDERAIVGARATLDGVDLGALAPLDPPVRFGFGSAPRTPAIVAVTTLIDSVT